MNKIVEQKVLVQPWPRDLDAAARELISEGWVPLGPAMCNNMPRFDWYQTLVRYG